MAESVAYHAWQAERTGVPSRLGCASGQARTSKTKSTASSRRSWSWESAFSGCRRHARRRAKPAQTTAERGSNRGQGRAMIRNLRRSTVGRLEATGPGCRWLIERWKELEASLERDGAWHRPERFRAFRLLRIRPSDAYFNDGLILFLQACQVLDPGAGSLMGELWNELVTPLTLASLEEAFQRVIRQSAVPDQAAAREELQRTIDGEVEKLEEKAAWHAERAELMSALSPHLLAFDDSHEGELMRRYENSCEKLLKRNLDELEKRRSQKTDSAMEIDYLSALPAWLNAHGRLRPGVSPKSETAQPAAQPPHVEALAGTELRNEPNGKPKASARTELRNEPNGMANASAGTELRNEPNGMPKPKATAVVALRNEPNGTPRVAGDAQATAKQNQCGDMAGKGRWCAANRTRRACPTGSANSRWRRYCGERRAWSWGWKSTGSCKPCDLDRSGPASARGRSRERGEGIAWTAQAAGAAGAECQARLAAKGGEASRN